MNLLINEPPLQVLPSLAVMVGLNKSIFLQQLHYRLLISRRTSEGFSWVCQTAEEWQEKEFPFWSVSTVKRIIKELEEDEYIVSTSKLNKMKMDRTKWYRINVEKMKELGQTQRNSIVSDCDNGTVQNDTNVSVTLNQSHCVKMTRPITKEYKSIKKNVEKNLDGISQIINYLNERTGKNFQTKTKATQQHINARFREGYTLEEFKAVIDVKTKQWLNDEKMNSYLRPSTLFIPENFENYLNETDLRRNGAAKAQNTQKAKPQAPQLDFSKGE